MNYSWFVSIAKKYRKELIVALTYIAVSFSISAYTYTHFLYGQFDLAIFTNALRQPWTHPLWSTIQGHHYFGDHFAPYLILFKPWLDVFQSPLILLFLQSVIIASTVIPLTAILRKIFPQHGETVDGFNPSLPLIILFFANPITIGINLYEFHPEVLLLPLLFTTFYYYLQKDFKKFAIFFILTLIIREDTVLTLLPFALLALIDRRKIKWSILPLISVPYLFLALRIIAYFNPTGESIFIKYYSWLGSSIPAIFINSITHPLLIINKLATIYVLEFVLATLMLGLFLPLLKPRYLIFAVLPYLSLALGPGQGVTILRSHYAIPILFAIIVASVMGLTSLTQKTQKVVRNSYSLILTIIFVAIIFLNIALGPYTTLFNHLTDQNFNQTVKSEQMALDKLDRNKPTLGSYKFLPYVKSADAYFLGYALQNRQQHSPASYPLPADLPQVIIDADDLITFQLNSKQEAFNTYAQNLKKIIEPYKISYLQDRFVILTMDGAIDPAVLATVGSSVKPTCEISGICISVAKPSRLNGSNLEVQLSFSTTEQLPENYIMKISYFNNGDDLIESRYFPIAYGLYPSSQWSTDREIISNYKFIISNMKEFKSAELELVALKGVHILDSMGSTKRVINEEIKITKPVVIFEDAGDSTL